MPRDLDAFPEVKTTPVFSLRGFVAWLETQPPETKYEWYDCKDCLLMRYLTARGENARDPSTYDRMQDIAHCAASSIFGETTYGAALARAHRALRAE